MWMWGQGGDCPGQWVMNFPKWMMLVATEPDLYLFSEARVVL